VATAIGLNSSEMTLKGSILVKKGSGAVFDAPPLEKGSGAVFDAPPLSQ
jgi:hypothetical protein